MRFILCKAQDCKWQHRNYIGDRMWPLHGVRSLMVNRCEVLAVQPVENVEIGQNRHVRC